MGTLTFDVQDDQIGSAEITVTVSDGNIDGNGELDINVKSPVLELTSKKFWSSVDARSKNLDFKAANCGKGEPMQGAPVWTGAPDVRLRNIRIGTRS